MNKKIMNMMILGLAIVTIGGCGTANRNYEEGATQPLEPPVSSPAISPSPSVIPKGQSNVPELQLLAEAQEGDFVLQLASNKSEYLSSEPVELQIRMKYTGELPEATISHSASAFSFLITETTRDIGIGYAMNQPLIHTTLKQGEWLEETYVKTGGYSDTDPDKEFIKQFLQGKAFPQGIYSIIGQADFTFYAGKPESEETKKTEFHFKTKAIEIVVN